MTAPLRTRLDELEIYVTRVAEATGIPPAHLEKDFWVTEVLRGASSASGATSCSVIFKGGTSLSKAHRIIRVHELAELLQSRIKLFDSKASFDAMLSICVLQSHSTPTQNRSSASA